MERRFTCPRRFTSLFGGEMGRRVTRSMCGTATTTGTRPRKTLVRQATLSPRGPRAAAAAGLLPWERSFLLGRLRGGDLRAFAVTSSRLASSATDGGTERVLGAKKELESLLASALAAAFPSEGDEAQWGRDVLVAPTANPKFACDYQCNNAMPLFAKVKGREGGPGNPRAVAEAIMASIPPNEILEDVSVAGPGFLNLRLKDAFLERRVGTLFAGEAAVDAWAPEPCCARAVLDFSSPNVAKEMHVGHLRSTIIGDTLARALEFTGVEVKRLNHVGDWGTQFGMLIQHMEEEGVPFDASVGDLQQLYKDSKARFDAEGDFKKRAQQAVVKLQSGSEESLGRWGKICDASRKEFNKIYDRLDIEIEERGESFYNPLLKDLVEELRGSGVAELSDGAICIFVGGSEAPPLIIQKSDGGFGYATTDLAALRQRLTDESADWIIYVTDSGQSQHFKGVFSAARKCGWITDEASSYPKVDHVGFGLVLGEDGKRLRTRSGDVIKLADLLDEAVSRCKEQLVQREYEFAEDEEKLEEIAQQMGYSAIKYADLKQNKSSNYEFSFDRMLDLKGNTAVYLQYAHARVCSILSKARVANPGSDAGDASKIRVTCEPERALLSTICQFPEAVESTVEDLAPNRLCDYLYGLTSKFTDFYSECKVIGSEEEASRILMCEATLKVMRKCFAILGMEPLERI
ncbi:arginine--tRNA ligase [Chloropicon primus]|uniref:arginine--tRNA ligase n=1 Tax=Chloropicon primus TaxID=1764295 RepID=A0A5B8MFW6_9CHLO|nr:arginine--tRNA ligase [Chloropicon primus]UPQ98486.1 arginine--tRNA ligase [Chloropicon primus]|eukprot:QDZ19277.1 arginine--tRNA ligase [Chloropicon primus]